MRSQPKGVSLQHIILQFTLNLEPTKQTFQNSKRNWRQRF